MRIKFKWKGLLGGKARIYKLAASCWVTVVWHLREAFVLRLVSAIPPPSQRTALRSSDDTVRSVY